MLYPRTWRERRKIVSLTLILQVAKLKNPSLFNFFICTYESFLVIESLQNYLYSYSLGSVVIDSSGNVEDRVVVKLIEDHWRNISVRGT